MKEPTNYEEARAQFFENRAREEERVRREWKSAWKIVYIGVPVAVILAWLISKLP